MCSLHFWRIVHILAILQPDELIYGWTQFLSSQFRCFSALVCAAAEAARTSQHIDVQGASLS